MARKTVVVLVALLWVALVIGMYYAFHRMWEGTRTPAPLFALMDLVIAAALVGLGGGIGVWLLGSLTGGQLDPLEQVAVQAAIGLGLMSLFSLALGIGGLLHPWVFWLTSAVGLILLRKSIAQWFRHWGALVAKVREAGQISLAVGGVCIVVVLLGLLRSLAPPLKWDALVYHLALPARYLDAHTLFIASDSPYLGMPHLGEMLYTWAMALRSGTSAAALGWATGVVMLVGVAGLAGRLLGSRAAIVALASMLVGATVARSLWWAYVDVFAMLFGLGTVVALNAYVRDGDRRWAVLAGALTGLGMGSKYSFAFMLLAGLGTVAISHREHRIRSTGLYSAAVVLLAAPWLIKNALQSGNPLYPFFFTSGAMDSIRQSFYSGGAPPRGLLEDLFLPIVSMMIGGEGRGGYAASLGPLYLALVPLVFLGWRRKPAELRRALGILLAVGGASWLSWAIGSHLSNLLQQSRLYMAAFPGLAVLAAAGFESISEIHLREVRVGRVAGILVALALLATGFGEVLEFADADPLPVLGGAQTESDYVAARLGWFGPAMQSLSRLPSESRVLMLWEARSYYCPVDCMPDAIIDRWYTARRRLGAPDEILESWKHAGATHLLLYRVGMQYVQDSNNPFFSSGDWSALEDTLSSLEPVENLGGVYTLYRLP